MQYFRDTATGAVFAFEDDVTAERIEGIWVFVDAAGDRLAADYPTTLEPTDDPTPPTHIPTPEQNVFTRDTLLALAALRIAPLEDAVDLEIETPDDVTRLKAWKSYRVALARLDLTASPVQWPEQPLT
ncbi:tail fiber assembly protein [Cupriavidus sp. KB_39]|jgi:hypothetical protein|uniref:tail fiber assembly protein n=1 Tax=Cupriavidus sp. KB_39 TaxID=3233036 RepID=UPI003F906B6D